MTRGQPLPPPRRREYLPPPSPRRRMKEPRRPPPARARLESEKRRWRHCPSPPPPGVRLRRPSLPRGWFRSPEHRKPRKGCLGRWTSPCAKVVGGECSPEFARSKKRGSGRARGRGEQRQGCKNEPFGSLFIGPGVAPCANGVFSRTRVQHPLRRMIARSPRLLFSRDFVIMERFPPRPVSNCREPAKWDPSRRMLGEIAK